MLLLTLALYNLTSSFPYTTSFLKSLEAEEKPNYINVIRFRDTSNLIDLLDVFEQPKIMLETSSLYITGNELKGFNYLDLPRYKRTSTLKLYFNLRFLTIIFIDNIGEIDLDFMMNFLLFSKLSTIVIISKTGNSKIVRNVMNKFNSMRFVNVIHIDVTNFENTKRFTTFETFPKYEMVSSSKFEKENVKNIRQKEIPIQFLMAIPYSYVYNHTIYENTTERFGGIQVNFFTNFMSFINGSLVSKKLYDARKRDFNQEFFTSMPFLALKDYQRLYPFSQEGLSNVLNTSNYFIVTPKSKPTEKKFYLVKIFSLGIWIWTFAFVIFGSGLFALFQMIIKKELQFWRMFGQLFRSSLAQSFPWSTRFNSTLVFYLIPMLFGFILTTWFCSILGSFTTTTLYEKQAMTFDDMRMQNIKIAIFEPNPSTSIYRQILPKDLLVFMKQAEYEQVVVDSKEYALMLDSLTWDCFVVPFMNLYRTAFYVHSDEILESSFMRIAYKVDSPYKEQLNRYIELVKDTGLYQHWCNTLHLELMKLKKTVFFKLHEVSSIQVLQLDFFTYAFLMWASGLTLSFIIFLMEVYGIFHHSKRYFQKINFWKNSTNIKRKISDLHIQNAQQKQQDNTFITEI